MILKGFVIAPLLLSHHWWHERWSRWTGSFYLLVILICIWTTGCVHQICDLTFSLRILNVKFLRCNLENAFLERKLCLNPRVRKSVRESAWSLYKIWTKVCKTHNRFHTVIFSQLNMQNNAKKCKGKKHISTLLFPWDWSGKYQSDSTNQKHFVPDAHQCKPLKSSTLGSLPLQCSCQDGQTSVMTI